MAGSLQNNPKSDDILIADNRKKDILNEFKKLSKSDALNGEYGFMALVSEGPFEFLNSHSYESIFYNNFDDCYKEYIEFQPAEIYKFFKSLHVVDMIYKTKEIFYSVNLLNVFNEATSDSYLVPTPLEKEKEYQKKSVLVYSSLTKDEQLYYEKKWNKFNKIKICDIAAENGWLDLLKWAREKNYKWNNSLLGSAAKNGHLKVLKWALQNGCQWYWYENNSIYECAAENGHFEVLKWIHENGCKWNCKQDNWTCAFAAKNGHLDMLKWARQNNCYWDKKTCAYAAKNGHLETLKWARQNGCEWDSWTCSSAALNGHLLTLKWARQNGCEWDSWTCAYAAKSGHLEVLKWARQNGCEWDGWTYAHAKKSGHLEVLKWIKENGYEDCVECEDM